MNELQNTDANQIQAMTAMPTDMALLKMENDQIFAVAKAQPRDPAKIVKQLYDLIEAYPAAAAGAVYSKPVGTVMEVTCGKCGIRYQVQKVEKDTACIACDSTEHGKVRPVKKFAEGLSIRAAETIRSVYGYTRLATKTELIEDDKVRVTGTVVDYASGNITSDERIVSPWYKSKGGQMTKTPEDRFLNVMVKAEKSKLRRDIILDNTPAIVKTAFRDMCEAKNGLLVTPEEIEQKILPAFATFGITPQHLDLIIGTPRSAGWTEDHRLQLRKILVGLKQDETTVRELLDGMDGEKQKSSPVPQAGASINDLAGKPENGKQPAAKTTEAAKPPAEPNRTREPGDDSEPLFNPPNQAEQEAARAQLEAEECLAAWGEQIAACEDVTACNKLEQESLPGAPQALRARILELILARRTAIRGRRGK